MGVYCKPGRSLTTTQETICSPERCLIQLPTHSVRRSSSEPPSSYSFSQSMTGGCRGGSTSGVDIPRLDGWLDLSTLTSGVPSMKASQAGVQRPGLVNTDEIFKTPLVRKGGDCRCCGKPVRDYYGIHPLRDEKVWCDWTCYFTWSEANAR
jgi:hypothetical protein